MSDPTFQMIAKPAADPSLWRLDPKIIFLNHGSFGACPRSVLEYQREMQNRMERQPCEFFVRDLEPMLDAARAALAQFVGASPGEIAFVPNATAGVNTILRSLQFKRGDELLVTNHEYNACRNTLDHAAARSHARVVVAEIPFPLKSTSQIFDAVLSKVTPRTRLALLDHVSSQTGLVFPIAELAARLADKKVEVLVDGAHAPGMLPLNLTQLGVSYYTGNCHKWICAPKGAALLYVRQDRQKSIRPLAISHGANSTRQGRSRFLIEFDWTGTFDPSAYLSVPEALRVMNALVPGGWPEIMARNCALTLAARKLICEALGIELPCPEELIGSLASFPLPDSTDTQPPTSPLYADPQQDHLRLQHQIEVPVIPWPAPPKRLLRISAQLYNSLLHYEALAQALQETFNLA